MSLFSADGTMRGVGGIGGGSGGGLGGRSNNTNNSRQSSSNKSATSGSGGVGGGRGATTDRYPSISAIHDPCSIVGDASTGVAAGWSSAAADGHEGGAVATSVVPTLSVRELPPIIEEGSIVPRHRSPWERALHRVRSETVRTSTDPPINHPTASSSAILTPTGGSPTNALLTNSGSSYSKDDELLRRRLESALRVLRIKHSDASYEVVDVIYSFARMFSQVSSTSACDVYHMTEALLTIQASNLNVMQSPQILQEYCGTFLMLFHHLFTELYEHFHVEGVQPLEWVPDYLRCLLARQLPLNDHLRLMDSYFADCNESGGFPLHVFVCLAILSIFTEELMEMDRVQILEFLQRLPRVDAELLLRRALSISESVLSRELL